MAKITVGLGILLVLIAGISFVATGSTHPTSLIPAAVGFLFVVFGLLANSGDAKKRMLLMHISVTVALLMFLATVPADIDVIRLSRGVVFPHPVAVEEKAATSLLCLLYVLLCVRSFINARRSRTV